MATYDGNLFSVDATSIAESGIEKINVAEKTKIYELISPTFQTIHYPINPAINDYERYQ